MKINPFRMMVMAAAAFTALSFVPASADNVNFSIQVGAPPPPLIVDRPWARPYPQAVWIGGHHEWVRDHWVYVGGYYAYPPRPGSFWQRGRYSHGRYYPGRWSR